MDNETQRTRLLKTPEAAEFLNRHPAVLADWRHQGRGPRYIKTGVSIRYRMEDLEAWLDIHTVDPSAPSCA